MTLAQVAQHSPNLAQFKRALQAWSREVAGAGCRPALRTLIDEPPPSLRTRFAEGAVADATLADCARRVAALLKEEPPAWTNPAAARPTAPLPLPRINVRLRRGRPPISLEARRAANAARQRRFQQRRRALLHRLLAESGTRAEPVAPPARPEPTITNYTGPD